MVVQNNDDIAFSVNGSAVYTHKADSLLNAPVGIAVFGKGQFMFDELRVQPLGALALAQAARNNQCGLPGASEGAEFVSVSVYEGAAASPVVVGPAAHTTSVAELRIDQGATPLYILVNSHDSMIWQVTGATERLAHLAVIGSTRSSEIASGVTGITRDRVSFHEAPNCLSYVYDEASSEFSRYRIKAMLAANHPLDADYGEYEIVALRLPGGERLAVKAPTGIDPSWRTESVDNALRFDPAGVALIKASDVVTDSVAQEMAVLPGQWGIAQLEAKGLLVEDGRGTYRITGKMHYPPGLHGAHSVRFLLEPGVPMPSGDPGHSQVTVLLAGGDQMEGEDEDRPAD